jgi:hypothetical protein
MLKPGHSLYDIYSQTFGKVRSGTKIENKDYAFQSLNGATPYDEKQRLAVTVAVDDQKAGREMRSKTDLENEINRLLS